MALFRFAQEQEFIRFLNDTAVLRHAVVRAVVRRAGFGGPVEVVTRPLPDADFGRIEAQLPAYRARAALEEESVEMATRGLDMGRYIETIRAEAIGAATGWQPGSPERLLLLVEEGDGRFERARDLLFRFHGGRDSQVMVGKAEGRPFFLFRLQGLRSCYPLMEWETAPGHALFEPLEGNPGCFIRRGYRFPLRDLGAYHPGLGAVNLIGPDGWWWTSPEESFHPLGDLLEVHFVGARPLIRASVLPRDQLPVFRVEIRMEEDGGGGDEESCRTGGIVSAHRAGQRVEDRLAELERARWELESEIERVRHETRPLPAAYEFEGEAAVPLLRFMTRYPLSQLRAFCYAPLPPLAGNAASHLVLPVDEARPDFLPEEIARAARLYRLHAHWYRRHRFRAYVPRGRRLVPDLEFSSPDALAGLLGGEPDRYVFILGATAEGAVVSRAVAERIPLEEAVGWVQAAEKMPHLEELRQRMGVWLEEEHRRALEAARARLLEASGELVSECRGMMDRLFPKLEHLEQELEKLARNEGGRLEQLAAEARRMLAKLAADPAAQRAKELIGLLAEFERSLKRGGF